MDDPDVDLVFNVAAAEMMAAAEAELDREEALHRSPASPIAGYLYDAVGFFVTYAPGLDLNDYQDEVLGGFYDAGRQAVVSPHGVGKTRIAACLVVHFGTTREAAGINWLIPTTASRLRQLSEQLWPEIHRVLRYLDWALMEAHGLIRWERGKQILDRHLVGDYGRAYAATSTTAAGIEGAHADHILYIFDEAKAVKDEVFDASEGALVGEGGEGGLEAYAYASSTPGDAYGRFYHITKRDPRFTDWSLRWVRLNEAVAAGRISEAWVEARKRSWGEDSAIYRNRVLGEYAPDDEQSLIKLSWVEAAVERWHEARIAGVLPDPDVVPEPGKCRTGVDVAAMGADKTVILRRQAAEGPDGPLRVVDIWTEDYTEDVVELAHTAARKTGPHSLTTIDSDGLGMGTAHEYATLHEKFPLQYLVPYRSQAFLGGQGVPLWKDLTGDLKALNRRSAGWWALMQDLSPNFDDLRPRLALPPNDDLIGDLTAVRYGWSAGKIKIEEKAKTKDRIHRSPDYGDALMMSGWVEPKEAQGTTLAGLNSIYQRGLGRS